MIALEPGPYQVRYSGPHRGWYVVQLVGGVVERAASGPYTTRQAAERWAYENRQDRGPSAAQYQRAIDEHAELKRARALDEADPEAEL